ncbi:peptidylprolyl isomerase [Hyphomonas sp.]|uniref:peptidylprolyl isomerase n=1 Tax=Hyphomonas sp. TaxID=87 RepID=UPI0035294625
MKLAPPNFAHLKFAPMALAASALALSFTAFAEDADEPAAPAEITVADAKADPANWRQVDPENLFIFQTTKGRILIEAFPEVAPHHYQQFAAIIRSGDYDGTGFHRVIDDFMAQGGDIFALKGRDSGLPDIEGEFTFRRDPAAMPLEATIGPEDTAKFGYIKGFPIGTQASFFAEMSVDGMVESYIPHCKGITSTARTDDPNSANAQFFLMRGQAEHLDRKYTAWGRVVAGEDVVKAIKHGLEARDGYVDNPDILTSAKVAADLPEAERPEVWVERTDGPIFLAEMADKDDIDVCSLPSVPAVVDK